MSFNRIKEFLLRLGLNRAGSGEVSSSHDSTYEHPYRETGLTSKDRSQSQNLHRLRSITPQQHSKLPKKLNIPTGATASLENRDKSLNDGITRLEATSTTNPLSSTSHTLHADLNDDSIFLQPLAHRNKLEKIESKIAENSLITYLYDFSDNTDADNTEAILTLGHYEIVSLPKAWDKFRSIDDYIMAIEPSTREQNVRARHTTDLTQLLHMFTDAKSNRSHSSMLDRLSVAHSAHLIGQSEHLLSSLELGLIKGLLSCRNLLIRICQNISTLQENSLCNDFISLIHIDTIRENVAKLITIPSTQILKLTYWVDRVLLASIFGLQHGLIVFEGGPTVAIGLREIQEHLEDIHDFLSIHFKSMSESLISAVTIVALILNLAVRLYCGAHLEPVGESYLDGPSTISNIRLCYPFDFPSYGVEIRRRGLSCLDVFLKGHPVWLFDFQPTR